VGDTVTDLENAAPPTGAVDPVPWHLSGNFTPVRDELTVSDLVIEGNLPESLRGTYVRNGFDPRHGRSDHWFYGHGMLHAVELGDGRADYRNRYVRTPYWEKGTADMVSLMALENSPANTHIVPHSGSLLALEELHAPYRVSTDLETLGMETFGGRITKAFTAHPKVCPQTGELLAFGYDIVQRPYLTYYRISPEGEVVQAEPIEIPNPVMMHDWNVTENNVVFMDLPVRFDMTKVTGGDPPFVFDAEAGARLGVMPRDGTNADVVWHEIEPCFVFHPVNAHEIGDRIVLTVCRQPTAMSDGFDDFGDQATLWRWTIDTASGTVREEQLDDRRADFPRIDDRRVGLEARFGYIGELVPGQGHPAFGSRIFKYDLTTGEADIHDCGPKMHIGEPVFAPSGPDAAEDDGWVLCFVYDEAEDRSELRVIDARNMSGPPVARIHMPRRVPFGAHGSWLPAT
jgi:carotenoid cleavage dioxygenase-like enzyme